MSKTFKASYANKEIVEQPGMRKPGKSEHPNGSTVKLYEQHMDSLISYPASWVTLEMDNQPMELDKDFKLQHQLQDFISGKERWTDCDEYSYSCFTSMKRIIAIPVNKNEGGDLPSIAEILSTPLEDELMQDKLWEKLTRVVCGRDMSGLNYYKQDLLIGLKDLLPVSLPVDERGEEDISNPKIYIASKTRHANDWKSWRDIEDNLRSSNPPWPTGSNWRRRRRCSQ